MVACQGDPKASQEYKDLKAELDKIKGGDSLEAANKELYKKIAEVNDTTELGQLDTYIAADFNFHNMPEGMPNGLAGFKELLKGYFTAVPGMKMDIVHLLAEGDVVMAHIHMTGVNSGAMGPDMPATGKSIDVDGYDCVRIEGGKVVEYWSVADEKKMMEQMGLMPPMGGEEPAKKGK